MADYSNPMNPKFGKTVDPVILAAELTRTGYDVAYLDANSTRLRHAEMCSVNAIDMSRLHKEKHRKFGVVVVVNFNDFHMLWKIQWKELAGQQVIQINTP